MVQSVWKRVWKLLKKLKIGVLYDSTVWSFVYIYKKMKTVTKKDICTLIFISVSVQSLGHVPMDCNTPGLPVHHHLPEFTQTQVHRVADAIQSSHPLSSPSPPAFNLSQHQGLFQWVSSLHHVAKVLELQL